MILNYLLVLIKRQQPEITLSRTMEKTSQGVGLLRQRSVLKDGSRLQVSAIFTDEDVVGSLFSGEKIIAIGEEEEDRFHEREVIQYLSKGTDWKEEYPVSIEILEKIIQGRIDYLIGELKGLKEDSYLIRDVKQDGYHLVMDIWEGQHLMEVKRISIFEEALMWEN